MNHINLMDCTLRDGGWVNDFAFGSECLSTLPVTLAEAGVPYIELGYLDDRHGRDHGFSMYSGFEALAGNTGPASDAAERLVMIDYGKFSPDHIPVRSRLEMAPVNGIRLCFHKKDMEGAAEMGRMILEKGYHLYIQPMVNTSYSVEELCALIDLMNRKCRGMTAFYIVDSFGTMEEQEIRERLLTADAHLAPGVLLGLHTHNNLSLAFANSRAAVGLTVGGDASNGKSLGADRSLLIDATVMGIGKGAGNLSTEEFAAFLNREAGTHFQIGLLNRIREEWILPLHLKYSWGCSPEYELTSRYCATPSYARYFVQDHHLPLTELEQFLMTMPEAKKESFDRACADEYIERLGYEYL